MVASPWQFWNTSFSLGQVLVIYGFSVAINQDSALAFRYEPMVLRLMSSIIFLHLMKLPFGASPMAWALNSHDSWHSTSLPTSAKIPPIANAPKDPAHERYCRNRSGRSHHSDLKGLEMSHDLGCDCTENNCSIFIHRLSVLYIYI